MSRTRTLVWAAAAMVVVASVVPAAQAQLCPTGFVPTDFYLSDFEADDGGWVVGGFGDWERGTPDLGVHEDCDTTPRPEPPGAFSGDAVWATNLDGCYVNSGDESLLSQTFDFSALSAPIELSWWNWYEIFTPFDEGEVRADGTLVFAVLSSVATPGWVEEAVDLSAFAGDPAVTLDFRLFATTVVNRSGWYLDDVRIRTCVEDVPDAPHVTEIPTLGGLGMTVLVLLMTVAAAGVLRRQRRAGPPVA